MSGVTHADMVGELAKTGEKILETMTAEQAALMHMTMGICGEAGELLDAIKKHIIYNKPLDLANVVEELGDMEFYMEGLRQILHMTREHTLDENIRKLSIRYKDLKYSNEAAQIRADKA